MKPHWRKVGVIAVAVFGTLSVAGWIAVHPRIQDPYKFLEGRRPSESGVMGPGSWPAKQLRVYTWRQPWREVAAIAKRELPGHGLNPVSTTEGVCWMGEMVDGGPCGIGSDTQIDIFPGKAMPLTLSGEYTDHDPEWVTVAIATDLEEGWINVIRYTFFAIPEE